MAFLNARDQYHVAAVGLMDSYPGPMVTTAWVVDELGNYLAGGPLRRAFVPFVRKLQAEGLVEILPPDEDLWDRGIDLYGRRPDKKWSLTDCISFVVMRERKIRLALTADHHFEQAGFTILMK